MYMYILSMPCFLFFINPYYLQPRACLENEVIYAAVGNVLQAFLDETQANADILRVIDYFYQALQCCANDHTKEKV